MDSQVYIRNSFIAMKLKHLPIFVLFGFMF